MVRVADRRPPVRARALLGVLMMLGTLGLVACGEDDEAPQLRACEEFATEAEWDSCFTHEEASMHCLLETLRKYHAQGRFELSELPEWAITAERNGDPVIFDIRARETPVFLGDALGQLKQWAEQRGLVDEGEIDRCEVSVTEAEMREAEGGGRETTEWGEDGDEASQR